MTRRVHPTQLALARSSPVGRAGGAAARCALSKFLARVFNAFVRETALLHVAKCMPAGSGSPGRAHTRRGIWIEGFEAFLVSGKATNWC